MNPHLNTMPIFWPSVGWLAEVMNILYEYVLFREAAIHHEHATFILRSVSLFIYYYIISYYLLLVRLAVCVLFVWCAFVCGVPLSTFSSLSL